MHKRINETNFRGGDIIGKGVNELKLLIGWNHSFCFALERTSSIGNTTELIAVVESVPARVQSHNFNTTFTLHQKQPKSPYGLWGIPIMEFFLCCAAIACATILDGKSDNRATAKWRPVTGNGRIRTSDFQVWNPRWFNHIWFTMIVGPHVWKIFFNNSKADHGLLKTRQISTTTTADYWCTYGGNDKNHCRIYW